MFFVNDAGTGLVGIKGGVARGTFTPRGTTEVSYFEFAEPVSFTSAGTSLTVRLVTRSNALSEAFLPVTMRDDGANRFTIPAANLDPDADGRDFFRR